MKSNDNHTKTFLHCLSEYTSGQDFLNVENRVPCPLPMGVTGAKGLRVAGRKPP